MIRDTDIIFCQCCVEGNNGANGNNKKRETTVQVGVITGVEATTEGPLSKNSAASYLIGYRYSLAGVAQKLGVNIGTNATPTYQDLSFKINSGTSNFGKFSMFGILATSTIAIGGGSKNTLYGNGNQVDFARENGYVQTILGRRRYLKDINSANMMVKSGAERNAVNAPIQGSAADVIKIAMINIHKKLISENWKSKMLLQVHDELVFDVHNSELEKIQPMIKHEMENAFIMDVPLEVELGLGKNWLEAH